MGYKRYKDGEQTGRDTADRVSNDSFLCLVPTSLPYVSFSQSSLFYASPLCFFLPYLSLPCLSPMSLSPISLSSMPLPCVSFSYISPFHVSRLSRSVTLPWLSFLCLSSKRDRGERRGSETLERGGGRGTRERDKGESAGRRAGQGDDGERQEKKKKKRGEGEGQGRKTRGKRVKRDIRKLLILTFLLLHTPSTCR